MASNEYYGRSGYGGGDEYGNERRGEEDGGERRREGGYRSGYGEERRYEGNERGDRHSGGYGGSGGTDEYSNRPSGGYQRSGGGYGGDNAHDNRPSEGYGGSGGIYREDPDSRRHEGGYGGQHTTGASYGGGQGSDGLGGAYREDSDSRRHEGGYSGQHTTGTSYGGGGGYNDSSDHFAEAAHHASSHAGDSGDSSLFSTALGLLSGQKSKLQNEDVDEEDYVKQHQKFYGNDNSHGQANSQNVGAAAAMQALKMFTEGKQENAADGQNKFIGMAMGQAAQLFDKQNNQGKTDPGATKQDAVAQAAQMALKLYMKSEMGGPGAGSGGGNSGAGGLLNLASKFLK